MHETNPPKRKRELMAARGAATVPRETPPKPRISRVFGFGGGPDCAASPSIRRGFSGGAVPTLAEHVVAASAARPTPSHDSGLRVRDEPVARYDVHVARVAADRPVHRVHGGLVGGAAVVRSAHKIDFLDRCVL